MNLYTYTGKIAYPDGAPSIMDIAVGLSRECRYAGASVHWWPVALHSFVVADLLPPGIRLHGLLHDAAECITGDIPTPAKIPEMEILEDKLIQMIYRGLELTLPTKEQAKVVKLADKRALHGEVHTVGTRALREIYSRDIHASELVEYYREKFPPMECIDPLGSCVKEFLRRFEKYKKEMKRRVK